jgi:hypothetical protein
VLYGQTKDHTPKIRLKTEAIFLDLNISNEKQKTTTAVREISNELKKIPITAIVEAEKLMRYNKGGLLLQTVIVTLQHKLVQGVLCLYLNFLVNLNRDQR